MMMNNDTASLLPVTLKSLKTLLSRWCVTVFLQAVTGCLKSLINHNVGGVCYRLYIYIFAGPLTAPQRD